MLEQDTGWCLVGEDRSRLRGSGTRILGGPLPGGMGTQGGGRVTAAAVLGLEKCFPGENIKNLGTGCTPVDMAQGSEWRLELGQEASSKAGAAWVDGGRDGVSEWDSRTPPRMGEKAGTWCC